MVLADVLCRPSRAGFWAIDSGEVKEAGYSDTASAADRGFGFALEPWLDSWGPSGGPYDDLEPTADEEEWEKAPELFSQQTSYAAGSVEGWITDPAAMLAYATVRHFLRTSQWRSFTDLNEATRELFVTDLEHEPRGLDRFSALVTPVSGPKHKESPKRDRK